jgi:hypothetical protein
VAHWLRSIGFLPHVWVLETDPADLNEAERRWIARGRELGWRLTNLTDGGEGFAGRHSAETRARMSVTHRGVKRAPFTNQHRANLSLAASARRASPETRRKMSEYRRGMKPLNGRLVPVEV